MFPALFPHSKKKKSEVKGSFLISWLLPDSCPASGPSGGYLLSLLPAQLPLCKDRAPFLGERSRGGPSLAPGSCPSSRCLNGDGCALKHLACASATRCKLQRTLNSAVSQRREIMLRVSSFRRPGKWEVCKMFIQD